MEIVSYRKVGPITLAPIGDIQWFGHKSAVAWDALQQHIEAAMAREAWFIGMGDYVDFLSPSNRRRLDNANLYDTASRVVNDKAEELTRQLYDQLLKPTTGRWLGLLEGHHYAQLQTGKTTDQLLCELLRTTFLGTSAYISLTLSPSPGSRALLRYLIWLHHGQGGGSKAHAPLLKLENLTPYWEGDLFLVGHMSKMGAVPINRVHPVFSEKGTMPNRLSHRKIYLVGTGSWAKGYEEQSRQGNTPRGGYVETGMMNPVALGAPFITVVPRMVKAENRDQARTRGARSRATQSRLDVTVEV